MHKSTQKYSKLRHSANLKKHQLLVEPCVTCRLPPRRASKSPSSIAGSSFWFQQREREKDLERQNKYERRTRDPRVERDWTFFLPKRLIIIPQLTHKSPYEKCVFVTRPAEKKEAVCGGFYLTTVIPILSTSPEPKYAETKMMKLGLFFFLRL